MNKEYLTFKNLEAPFNIKYWKSFINISKRLLDKVILEKETNIIKKIEVYNYFDIKDIKKIIEYLKSNKFKYTNDKSKFNKLWNIILNQEWKHIVKNWRIVDINKTKYRHFYYIFFVNVLVFRNRTYLIKLYRNISKKKDFFKLEITYSYFKKNYNLHFLDYLNAMKSVNTIIGKIERRFVPIWFNEDFSQQITLDSFVLQMMWRLWKSWVNHINNIFTKLTGINYNE